METMITNRSMSGNGFHSRRTHEGSIYMAELIKVSSHSRSTAVAGAIAGIMRTEGYAEIQAIGASALNQAIKAIAIARGYVAEDGFDLVVAPSFTDVDIDGAGRTAIRLAVYKRALPGAMQNGVAQAHLS